MAVRTNLTYSGFNNQNAQRLKDIQKAESEVSVHYNSLGGDTERTSNWNIDENGNISYCAYVRREDKLNKELRKETEGVCYEKTISNAVVAGLEYIQGMEKKFSGTKFFVGTVGYGQTYGNSSDVNFVVNPKYLDKLGTDEETRKQFEEDVNYLNEFTKRFKQQQLSKGREIISQGWFLDKNGNWGGWTISRPIKQSSVLQDMSDYAKKIRQEKLEERKKAEEELKEHFGNCFKGLSIKWVEEEEMSEKTSLAVEDKEPSEEESETISGRIGVNVGKTSRKIAAAMTKTQLRAVMAEIAGDRQEVQAGIEKGWCDETEMDKVNLLMTMAQNRMGQVEDRKPTPEEETIFAMASLM